MVYEFRSFQLDRARRELRLSGREIALQPRVFDLLLYLVSERERVVTKEEILAAVWSDAIVSDGSLKRAVSLLRAALREGGCEEAIRTYPRQGYRFDVPELREVTEEPATSLSRELAAARRDYADDRWQSAAERFRAADAADGLEAPDLERWAEAEQCAGQLWNAIAPLERAVAAHSAAGDSRGAARAALGLAHLHYERMEHSVGKGWLERARSLLAGVAQCHEHGLLAAFDSRYSVAGGEHERAIECAEQAIAIGRATGDVDIELLGTSYLGLAAIAAGELRRGLAAHEEAAAAVLAGTASPRIASLVYCGLIWTCRNRGDWQRAAEWSERFNQWCERTSLESFAGTCRLHHAEVLHHRGALDAAEREAVAACQTLAELAPYAQGDGCRVLGDVRLAQGDVDAAEAAYRRAHEHGWDPQPGLALVMVARGRAPAALRALERSLAGSNWANRQRRGLLLTAAVPVALAAGEPERAREAVAELDRLLAEDCPLAIAAAAAQARAELHAHDADLDAAIAELRDAIAGWYRVGSPLHAARCRLRLAELYAAEGDREAADLELSAARNYLTEVDAESLLGEADRIARLTRDT